MIHRGKNIHRTDKEIRVLVNRFTIMLARLTDVLKFVLTSKVHICVGTRCVTENMVAQDKHDLQIRNTLHTIVVQRLINSKITSKRRR